MDRPLRLGAAYHGNRMPQHAREDMLDMARAGMDLVVHMFSHTDWDRHKARMRDIVDLSRDAGLDVWVDNWGLGGPPGDKSHFLAYHPEAHVCYSNGDADPVRACPNSPAFRAFTREWIDAVKFIGGGTIFWDEPHLPMKGDAYACCCENCKRIFRERYGREMPAALDEDAKAFRVDSVVDYFREVTSYSASMGIQNAVCVMLGEQHGLTVSTLDRICALDTVGNIGSDPYWNAIPGVNPYEYVYANAKKNLDISERFHKDHNIWIQSYATKRGREEEIVQAIEGAYDAGARTILAWGYYGSASNDYAAENPMLTWQKTCEGMRRVREMERDAILKKNRALVGKGT